jgi:hypothetical protein
MAEAPEYLGMTTSFSGIDIPIRSAKPAPLR